MSERQFFGRQMLRQFPTYRAAYSDRTAWLMARMSELAYTEFESSDEDMEKLKDILGSGGFSLCNTFNNAGTQAFLAESTSFAVLAFRGTQFNVKDIITDLKFRFYKGKHRGFWAAYDAVATDVRGAVRHVTTPIYITGHSLGAALAVLATQELDGDQLAACYTFGCPRVGNVEFDRTIKTPVYRVVNAADAVTRTPFSFMTYVHCGDLRYITARGRLLRNPNMFRRFGRFIKNIIFRWKSPIKDHFIENYKTKLLGIAESRN